MNMSKVLGWILSIPNRLERRNEGKGRRCGFRYQSTERAAAWARARSAVWILKFNSTWNSESLPMCTGLPTAPCWPGFLALDYPLQSTGIPFTQLHLVFLHWITHRKKHRPESRQPKFKYTCVYDITQKKRGTSRGMDPTPPMNLSANLSSLPPGVEVQLPMDGVSTCELNSSHKHRDGYRLLRWFPSFTDDAYA